MAVPRASPRSTEAVRRLESPSSSIAERVLAIQELVDLRALWSLPHVGAYVWNDSRELATAARNALEPLFKSASCDQLAALEKTARFRLYQGKPPAWTIDELSFLRNDSSAWGVLALHTFAPSGYVRNAAVTLLESHSEPLTIPLLMLRTVDWVPEVREAALASIQRRLRPADIPAFVAALPLLTELAERRLAGESPVSRWVLTLLGTPEARPAVLAGLRSRDRGVRLACMTLAVEIGVPLDEVVAPALTDRDMRVRAEGLKLLDKAPPSRAHGALARSALKDATAPLRARALKLVARASGLDAEPLLREALLDPSLSVRVVAVHLLKQLGPVDVPAFYRAVLSAPGTSFPEGALVGIGDTGNVGDAAEVVLFLDHPRARVRAAALRAFAQLSREEAQQAALEGLKDPSPRVCRVSRQLLARSSSSGAEDRMQAMVQELPDAAAVRVLDAIAGSSWGRLHHLLRALKREAPSVRERAIELIRVRVSEAKRLQQTPSAFECRTVQRLIGEVGQLLPHELQTDISLLHWRETD